ncbi:hypothetical protein PE066_02240 [Ramlibacter tataouinensis]|uniref:hypothetical protein n=1 Tax=Ramlibacter tataouinensis TaxID=94132 RepID=UPI0022F37F96|nr:hypothetical protein [Ramlibacter tataouinensis]WBY02374.1 hypothetical protein PE066_02240 [Ramlibacter tataouinensis]
MCYLARHQQSLHGDEPVAPRQSGHHRPRWAGAAAAAAVAGLALAASWLSPAAPPVSADEARLVEATVFSTLVPTPTVSQLAPVPAATEQVSITTTLDDGTPAPQEDVKAVGSACAHDL